MCKKDERQWHGAEEGSSPMTASAFGEIPPWLERLHIEWSVRTFLPIRVGYRSTWEPGPSGPICKVGWYLYCQPKDEVVYAQWVDGTPMLCLDVWRLPDGTLHGAVQKAEDAAAKEARSFLLNVSVFEKSMGTGGFVVTRLLRGSDGESTVGWTQPGKFEQIARTLSEFSEEDKKA